MKLSVIICAHNPRAVYLQRTLDSLKMQTLAAKDWEFIFVDNNSDPTIGIESFSFPQGVKLLQEKTPGLTAARIRGINEATGDLLVFVDDDNVLDPDYLIQALEISSSFKQMGVFGGRITPEFEVEPPAYVEPFRSNLALAEFKNDKWSNQRDFSVFPCGAGMCMLKGLAQKWADDLRDDTVRSGMGRKGKSLISGEDIDMILTCQQMGYGAGRFTRLHLLHLIPKERLEFDYQKRLAFGISYSAGVLNSRQSKLGFMGGLFFLIKSIPRILLKRNSFAIKRIFLSSSLGYLRGLKRLPPK